MPQPKPISQAELDAVLDAYQEVQRRALEIRCRVNSGAEVEPGLLNATSEGELMSTDGQPVTRIDFCGLRIFRSLRLEPEPREANKPETLPSWVLNTPATSYTLEAFSGDNGNEQRVDMDLAEFEMLKKTLARSRGFEVSNG